jgi:hypothetical protein
LIDLFESSIVPSELAIQLFETSPLRLSTDPHQSLLIRLQSKIQYLRSDLATHPLPSWIFDFSSFLRILVCEADSRLNPPLRYCLASPSELSLSRALLSPQFASTVQHLRTVSRREIGAEICNSVSEVIKKSGLNDLPESDLGIAYFLVHRNLFDLCYGSEPDLWKTSAIQDLRKVYRLREVKATSFELPLEFWSAAPSAEEPICEFVMRNPEFRTAVDSLSSAIFMSNPLDVLYQITVSITEMRAAAVENRDSRSPGNESLPISWDDTFLLFLAVFLASDLVDVFAVQDFLSDFAPRRLMPAFDDSRLMWEALAAHVMYVDPAAMV